MGSVSEYQKRARECFERAQIVTAAVDRARWHQLAEQWAALSRLPLQEAPASRNDPAGFWRGQLPKPLRQGYDLIARCLSSTSDS